MNINPALLFVLLAVLFTKPLPLEANPSSISNITVIGAVFCDACFNNTFTQHSYFLQGAKVLVECKFKTNSTSKDDDISVIADRITDRFGMYKLDIPPVDGFECREGRVIESSCRATLSRSSSPLCNSPGLTISTEHVALKCKEANLCVFNLNALNYRPPKRDAALCGISSDSLSKSLNTSLFFWPPFPPFGIPSFPPSLPFPFPTLPPTLPFTLPPWFQYPKSPSLPFPFPTSPPSLPFALPPWFKFPIPPSLPFTFSQTPNQPELPESPPIPPPQSPSLPFPWPFPQAPGLPSSPPPAFSLGDPRTWFPVYPPSSTSEAEDQKP